MPSRPGFVKLNVKTFTIGEYRASASDIMDMKRIQSAIVTPKYIGVGATVAIMQPRRMISYES